MLTEATLLIGFLVTCSYLKAIVARLDRQIRQQDAVKTLLGTPVPAEERERLQRMVLSMEAALSETNDLS